MYIGRFEGWTLEEWNAVWYELSKVALPRIPDYGAFYQMRRSMYLGRSNNNVAQYEAESASAAEIKRGLIDFQRQMVDVYDRNKEHFVADGPKPLAQCMVEWSIKMAEGVSGKHINREEAVQQYQENVANYKR